MMERDARSAMVQQAHRRGQAVLLVAAAAGVGVALWIVGVFGATPASLFQNFSVSPPSEQSVPRLRPGLVATTENRGRVLFGRYCDSCHTAGQETSLGSSLRSRQFKREFNTEAEITRRIREGGFDMPVYSKDLLSDADMDEIVRYVMGLPQDED